MKDSLFPRTRKRRRTLLLVAAAILVVALPGPARAWGPLGHRVIARIAQQHLNPKARSRLAFYFGKDFALEDLALWADEIRKERSESGPWHYLDIAPEATSLVMERDCPDGNCIAWKTREFIGIARLAMRKKDELLEPIKYIIHFGGDLHQPLHLGHPQDRGGTDIPVELDGRSMNLHQAWDSGILKLAGESEAALAQRLSRRITPEFKRRWKKGLLRDWSWETHLIAIRVAYAALPSGSPKVLDENYVRRAREVIDEQLAKGGVRLAELLNRTWP